MKFENFRTKHMNVDGTYRWSAMQMAYNRGLLDGYETVSDAIQKLHEERIDKADSIDVLKLAIEKMIQSENEKHPEAL